MEKERKKIDQIDQKIIKLLSKRVKLMKPIAKYKIKHNLEIEQLDREKEIKEKYRQLARENNINPYFTEDIFKRIIKECKEEQKDIIKSIKKI